MSPCGLSENPPSDNVCSVWLREQLILRGLQKSLILTQMIEIAEASEIFWTSRLGKKS